MKTTLRSGFQCGANLFRVVDDAVVLEDWASSCTWSGEVDSTHEVEISFPAVIVRRAWNAWGTTQAVEVEFVGVDGLDEPVAPRLITRFSAGGLCETTQIKTRREMLAALAEGEKPWEGLQDGTWFEVPFSWGDQTAACFARWTGEAWEFQGGCGDNTPYLDEEGVPRYPRDDERAADLEERLIQSLTWTEADEASVRHAPSGRGWQARPRQRGRVPRDRRAA